MVTKPRPRGEPLKPATQYNPSKIKDEAPGKLAKVEVTEPIGPLPPLAAWDDPCARYKTLSDAYLALLAGGQEASIRTRTLDAEEEVKFARGDIKLLKLEMDKAKGECEFALGLSASTTGRFAIGASHKPRCCKPRRP